MSLFETPVLSDPFIFPRDEVHAMPEAQATKSRVIAAEEHFLTEDFLRQSETMEEAQGEEIEGAFNDAFLKNPEMRSRFIDLPTRLREMDASGTDLALLSINPPGAQLYADTGRATSLARDVNDALVEIIKAQPTRFAGLGCLAPQDPEAAALEVKRIMGPLNLGGVMIASHTRGHYLDEPQFEPILAALEEEDATLYLHPRVPSPAMVQPFSQYGMLAAVWGFQAEAGTHAMRLIMSGTLDRHPKLKVVLGHCGEALPFWMWRLDNIHARTFRWQGDRLGMVKLQRKPTEYLRDNFAVTTSGMDDPDVLAFCIHKLGAENVLFAIDYPYEDSKTAVGFLAAAPLDARQRASVSHGNAERLFRIAPLVVDELAVER